ncbi:YceI family protein [Kiloniella laminariae]|uniref:YceI family protein n=1 Tax=Kiloniella laminariae TaxID=454162 RepID=A0ABT4LKQ5_9PROT|nr:YceI family protein [Kiloniella laminariae]MCZ4281657.1 YceI family protein [Kiloniella laminariae]
MRFLFRVIFSVALLVFGIMFLGRSHAEAAPLWSLKNDQSKVGFVAKQSGAEIPGVFEQYQAEIAFHPQELSNSHIRVEIATESVNTQSGDRDKLIRSNAFFDTAAHPKAIFEATTFEQLSPDSFIAHGSLTMRGVTKEIDLPFQASVEGDELRAQGEAEVSRLDYGIGNGQWLDTAVIGEMVRITFVIEGVATK